MNKAIFIGELTLNITLGKDGTAATRVGDHAVGAAMLLAGMGVPTLFVGEAGADTVGDLLVGKLSQSGVDTSGIDRFSDGVGSIKVSPADGGASRPVMHSSYPAEPANPVWPRINDGDVVVYGSYMAIDKRNHARVMELVSHAKARKAVTLYLPNLDSRVSAVTRVMPEIYDCLEGASIVMLSVDELAMLFPGKEPYKAFKDNILFFCNRCLLTDREGLQMHFYDGDSSWTRRCHATDNNADDWQAGAIAGVARALAEGITDADMLMERADETAHSTVASRLQ